MWGIGLKEGKMLSGGDDEDGTLQGEKQTYQHTEEQVWHVSWPQEAFKMGNQPWSVTVNHVGQFLFSDLLALVIHFRDLMMIIMDSTPSEAESSKWTRSSDPGSAALRTSSSILAP